MMKNLDIIRKLREERQTRAEMQLRSARAGQDGASQALAAAERAERVEVVLRRGREQRLYETALHQNLSHDALSRLTGQIDKFRRDAEALAEETALASNALDKAAKSVADAQGELARLYRARLKWDELRDRAVKSAIADAEAAEEDAIEDMLLRAAGQQP